MLHIIGNIIGAVMLGFWAAIFVGSVGNIIGAVSKWDCSKRGHKDSYYGCTFCRTSRAHKDKYNRPCCWFPAYDYMCGVCYMRYKGDK